MILKKSFTIAALSLLIPCALLRAQDAPATIQPTAAQTQPLQGSWEGVQVGHESAGKYTLTITGNSLQNDTLTLLRYSRNPPLLFEGSQDYRYDLKKIPDPNKTC